MKQAKTKLRSGEYCFLKVPKGAKMILEGDMPCGNWQLLGVDPTNLTEVEAGEIVETVSGWDNVIYHNYNASGRDYRDIVEAAFKSPAASLDSLAASLGIEKPFVVLKNIKHGYN